MTAPCSSAVAPGTQTALLAASGGEVNQMLTDVLTSEGWIIQHVADFQDVLDVATTTPFDLIIIERKTRRPQDVELFRKIRNARPHVRLIVLADEFTPGDVITAMREGAFSYFSAPFEALELTEMVRAAMAAPC